MNKRYDSSAAIELPFRMIIISVIMILTITIVAQGMYTYSRNKVENDIEVELAKFERHVKLCKEAGHGTTIPVELNFKNSFMVSLTELRIGGDLDLPDSGNEWRADCTMVKYKISSGSERNYVITPAVILTGNAEISETGCSGEQMVFGGGTVRLQLVHEEYDREVIISVIPI